MVTTRQRHNTHEVTNRKDKIRDIIRIYDTVCRRGFEIIVPKGRISLNNLEALRASINQIRDIIIIAELAWV